MSQRLLRASEDMTVVSCYLRRPISGRGLTRLGSLSKEIIGNLTASVIIGPGVLVVFLIKFTGAPIDITVAGITPLSVSNDARILPGYPIGAPFEVGVRTPVDRFIG